MHKGNTLTLPQQVENLRILGESRAIDWMLPGALAAVALGLLGFWQTDGQTRGVLCLFVAGCGGLIALAAGFGAKHIRNAAAATHKGRRVPATLHLLENDEGDDVRQFRGWLTTEGTTPTQWEIVFAPVSGWKPVPGTLRVEASFLSDIGWPVLVYCEGGLLWPHGTPRNALG